MQWPGLNQPWSNFENPIFSPGWHYARIGLVEKGRGDSQLDSSDSERDLRYETATLGSALSGKDTGASQFFITPSPQPHLVGGYTIFGQVIEGMDVVNRIARGDRIERVEVIEAK